MNLICLTFIFIIIKMGFSTQHSSKHDMTHPFLLNYFSRLPIFCLFLPSQIFSPYGRVDDVYLMRDEFRQSRGLFFYATYLCKAISIQQQNSLSGSIFSAFPFGLYSPLFIITYMLGGHGTIEAILSECDEIQYFFFI